VISLNVDAYGLHARGSALADYVELLAIHGHQFSRADFVEFVADADWHINPHENITAPGQQEDKLDEADERVYNLIYERRDILGNLYPFAIDASDRLTYAPGVAPDLYGALLGLTLAHAYHVAAPHDPKQVFEETVASILSQRGWIGVNFGALRRGAANFPAALAAAGPQLRLPANADAAPHNKKAQDEGVDSIHHVEWCTTRTGRWLILGQVTCAVSNDWQNKIMEPLDGIWGPMLGDILAPWIFLAVPHHAEPNHRRLLIQGTKRLLLDRLSLTPHKNGVTAEEQAVRDAVMAEGVETP
jgi:hypothetical protein